MSEQTPTATGVDEGEVTAFMQKVVADAAAVACATTVSLGDRLGIYTALAKAGPVTPGQLAERTGLSERHLREWLAAHPGGKHLFCQAGVVARSSKRSKTTGHKGEKTRESSLKGRTATVRKREQRTVAAVTKDEAHDHLKRALAGSRWEVLKGYHVLRHSFISCLAAEGVDQRIIDRFMGHQTPQMRERYQHLFPKNRRSAIESFTLR